MKVVRTTTGRAIEVGNGSVIALSVPDGVTSRRDIALTEIGIDALAVRLDGYSEGAKHGFADGWTGGARYERSRIRGILWGLLERAGDEREGGWLREAIESIEAGSEGAEGG